MNIDEFIEQSRIQASVDLANPASVKKANLAADKMAQIAEKYSEVNAIEELLSILDHETAGSWVACLVAKLPNVSNDQKLRCIEKVKIMANGADPLLALGAKMWLKERGYNNS